MRISVNYFGQVRAAIGTSAEELDITEAMDARDLVLLVAARHGESARRMLLDDAGNLQRGLLIVVNDEQVLPDDARLLADGDRVAVMPPISGGASIRTFHHTSSATPRATERAPGVRP